MKSGRWVITALLVVSVVVTIAGNRLDTANPLPSITNPGPRGAAVLATWLREAGVDVRGSAGPFETIADDVKTVVIAAPGSGEVKASEVEVLTRFVERGGVLVLLDPRGKSQPALENWLDLHPGELPPIENEPGLSDATGTTVEVHVPGGALAGLRRFRVAAEPTIQSRRPEAVPVTTWGALWWLPLGEGEVWVGAGADLIENARLELHDNARFWSALAARGPILFDEYHLTAPAASLPVSVTASGLQLLLLALLFLWARAPRLGAHREAPPTAHRTSLDYVRAMGLLTANAKVEGELVQALKHEFRRRLDEELGIATSLPWADAVTELERRTGHDAGGLKTIADGTSLLEVGRALALAERALR